MAKGKATSAVTGPDPSVEELERQIQQRQEEIARLEAEESAKEKPKPPKGKRSPPSKAARDLYNAKRRDKRQTMAAAKVLATGLSPKKPAAPAAKSPSKKRKPVVRTDKVRAAERRSAARHLGSKSEVFHQKEGRYGELRTRSGLQKVHLVPVTKTYKSLATGKKYSRKRIAYRSRHEVGKLIKRMMYEPIRDSNDLQERIQDVKDYLETSIRLKYDPKFRDEVAAAAADGKDYDEDAIMEKLEEAMAKSSLLERYESIDPKKGGIVAHNNKVKEWSKTWKATNEKQRDYFTAAKRVEGDNEAYYNYKKPRLHGHFATSGSKARRCLSQGGSLEDCAKTECNTGHQRSPEEYIDENGDVQYAERAAYDTKEGQKYHCEEQGWEPKFIARKNNATRVKKLLAQNPDAEDEELELVQKPITGNPYVRDGEDSD